MEAYPSARENDNFGRDHPLWQAFEDAESALNATEAVAGNETLVATFSVGQGNWARIPWIALLDQRETTSTQRGVYPVYLFRQDGSGVYLTLGQGVTEPKRELGAVAAHDALEAKATELRGYCRGLESRGFSLDGQIDLRSDPGLGRDYEVSVAAHKLYERGSIPDDAGLIDDLTALLDAYSAYLDRRTSTDLARLIATWRSETGYPDESAAAQTERRKELVTRLDEALLTEVEADPTRFEELSFGKLVHGYYYGSPGPMSTVNEAVKSSDENRTKVARSLRHLIYGPGLPSQRIDDVVAGEEFKVPGFGVSLAAKALAIGDPEHWIPIYPYDGESGKRAMMQLPELGLGDPAELESLSVGEKVARSNDLLRQTLEPHIPGDLWGQSRFLYWLRDRHAEAPSDSTATGAVSELAEALYLDEPWLRLVIQLAEERRQIIFKGPPGTGKTYVARKLADHLAGDASRVRLVQFHASYAYEDFVQGYRPTVTEEGDPAFKLVDGPLVDIARKAASDRSHTYVLLIDELNRGNVGKVFGELYFLLEYRDEAVRLQYGAGSGDPELSLPDNLLFIGTMNTADQSIALLDSALRRRFFFVDFYPTEPPIEGLLRRWLQENGYREFLWLADVIDEVNRRLGDREIALGPSYFLDSDHALTNDRIDTLWRYAILPYLEEQFLGQEDRRADFELTSLREAIQRMGASSEAPTLAEERVGESSPPGTDGAPTD